MHNKPHSKEAKEKISKALKGRKLSRETRLKMSVSRKGHPFWGKRGYRLSDESRANIKNGILEKRNTAEYIKKLSRAQTGERNHQSKLTTDKVIEIREAYEECAISQQALANKYDVSRSTIADIIHKRTWQDV